MSLFNNLNYILNDDIDATPIKNKVFIKLYD